MPLIQRVLLPAAGALALLAVAAALTLGLPDGAGSAWARQVVEIQAVQRDLHRQLADAMQAVQAEGAAASWTLIGLSFLYGVFHAAGPGHGKVVISTYLLTQESELRRGLLLSFAAALCQGVTAIAAVAVTAGLLHLSLRQAQSAASDLETLSYAFIALLGAALVVTRLRRLIRRRHIHPPHDHRTRRQHDGGDPAACDHDHGPSRAELEAPLSWRSFAGMVLSIGIRPCSGAILVLLAAYSLDLRWAGIGAVLAMSLGTALTVSLLATLSVYARKTSLRLAEMLPGGSRSGLARALDVVALLGGLVILLLGALLLQAAWTAPAHPFA